MQRRRRSESAITTSARPLPELSYCAPGRKFATDSAASACSTPRAPCKRLDRLSW